MFQKNRLGAVVKQHTLVLLGAITSSYALAEEPNSPVSYDSILEEVEVLGTRRAVTGSATNTLAPVDMIGESQLETLGSPDMLSNVANLIPSFNVSQQPNSDEAAFIRPANLRTLPPDNTLVLVNGKRRHRGAIISFLGEGINDGAQGPDISAIPGIALENIQVLRDGAAAQYGSDAIAGVINFKLKEDSEGGVIQARFGEYSEGDGDTMQLSGNIGLPLTDSGYINISADYSFSDLTSRTVQRRDAAELIAAGNTAVEDPAMIWGAPEVKDNYRFFVNSGLDVNDTTRVYAFGNFSTKEVETEFFYRNPNTRGGVFTNDGGETILVGDLNLENDIACPTIAVTGNVPDPTALASISTGGSLDSECFAFNEVYPGGFTPRMGGTVEDKSLAFGLEGEFSPDFTYDVSYTWGQSVAEFYLKDSVNASLGANSPSYFELGENRQTDSSFNLDLNYSLPVDAFASDLNVASGFEWREEKYEVISGEQSSYEVGPLAAQGFSSGSNGFAGFGSQSAGEFSRDNIAFYLDLEADILDNLAVGLAVRWEDFDDFGSTTNGKLSARYQFTDSFALRSTVSTGFRAPTPGQSNIIRTRTQGVVDSEGGFSFVESGILPATNPVAVELASIAGGIDALPLEPETSTNYTLGAVFDLGGVSLTVDYFRIDIEDRIALTSNISIDRDDPAQAAILNQLSEQGIPGSSTLTDFQFFTNDFETTTQGIDVAVKVPYEFGSNGSELLVAYNRTETELAELTDLIDETRKTQLEDGLPQDRITLTNTTYHENWTFLVRANYYSSYVVATDAVEYGAKTLFDLEVGYNISDSLIVNVGAQNIFDTYPDEHPDPAGNSGQIYPEQSPFGFNGAFYYMRVTQTF